MLVVEEKDLILLYFESEGILDKKLSLAHYPNTIAIPGGPSSLSNLHSGLYETSIKPKKFV